MALRSFRNSFLNMICWVVLHLLIFRSQMQPSILPQRATPVWMVNELCFSSIKFQFELLRKGTEETQSNCTGSKKKKTERERERLRENEKERREKERERKRQRERRSRFVLRESVPWGDWREESSGWLGGIGVQTSLDGQAISNSVYSPCFVSKLNWATSDEQRPTRKHWTRQSNVFGHSTTYPIQVSRYINPRILVNSSVSSDFTGVTVIKLSI